MRLFHVGDYFVNFFSFDGPFLAVMEFFCLGDAGLCCTFRVSPSPRMSFSCESSRFFPFELDLSSVEQFVDVGERERRPPFRVSLNGMLLLLFSFWIRPSLVHRFFKGFEVIR